MPELPEVETNMRNLRAWTRGRTIVEVVPPPGTRETFGVAPTELRERLEGRTVEDVERRGKWILSRLSGDAGLGLHLGMTGKIARAGARAELPRFTRALFILRGGERICFVDSRRFGKVLATRSYAELLERDDVAGGLGPDALAVDAKTLRARLGSTKRTIKEAIMDQRVLAGVGNLYATEALWRARLHPATPAPIVAGDAAASRALASGIRAALRHGLAEYDGVELPEYIEEGGDNPFFVYDRAGERCPRCKTSIRAITLGGRTTAFCPRCQRARRRA
jgi:formamidopyrimidine-DNA glycosylase